MSNTQKIKTRIQNLEVINNTSINDNFDVKKDVIVEGGGVNSQVLPHKDNDDTIIGILGTLNKLFDVPPKYKYPTDGRDPTETTTVSIKLNWEKDFKPLTLNFIENKTVPNVNYITIDIKKDDEDWKNTNLELDKDDTSYTFTSGSGINYNGVTIDKEISYNFRVYGVNYTSGSSENIDNFYLEYNNLRLDDAGTPSKPTNVTVSSSSIDKFNISFNKPDFNDKDTPTKDIPLLKNSKIEYQPTETKRRKGFNDLDDSEQVVETGNTLSPISVSNNIIPGTTYELTSFKMNNTQNDNDEYGDDAFTNEDGHITISISTPTRENLSISDDTFGANFTMGKKNIYNINEGKGYNANYFNIDEDQLYDISSNNLFTEFLVTTQGNDEDISKIITFKINDEENTTIKYTVNKNQYDGNVEISYVDISVSDVTNTDPIDDDADVKKGFGLVGKFKLNNLVDCIGLNKENPDVLFTPSSEPYKITYELNGSEESSFNFYVDNLVGFPDISNDIALLTVTEYRYCYGIPSAYKFSLLIKFKLSNYRKYFVPKNKRIYKLDYTYKTEKRYLNISDTIKDCASNIFENDEKDITNLVKNEDTYFSKGFKNLLSDDSDFSSNKIKITGKSLNGSTVKYVDITISGEGLVHNDSVSFVHEFNTNVNSFAYDNIYLFNFENPYDVLENPGTYELSKDLVESRDFSLNDNTIPYYNGGFFINSSDENYPFVNWKDDYQGEGLYDYSNKINTGDIINRNTYKWIIKKFNTTRHNINNRKKLKITVNRTPYDNMKTLYNEKNIITFISCKVESGESYNQIFSIKNYTTWMKAYTIFFDSYSSTYDDDFYNNKGILSSSDTNFLRIPIPSGVSVGDSYLIFVLIGVKVNDRDDQYIKIEDIELINV